MRVGVGVGVGVGVCVSVDTCRSSVGVGLGRCGCFARTCGIMPHMIDETKAPAKPIPITPGHGDSLTWLNQAMDATCRDMPTTRPEDAVPNERLARTPTMGLNGMVRNTSTLARVLLVCTSMPYKLASWGANTMQSSANRMVSGEVVEDDDDGHSARQVPQTCCEQIRP